MIKSRHFATSRKNNGGLEEDEKEKKEKGTIGKT